MSTKHTPGPWRVVLAKPTKRDPQGVAMVAAGGRMAIDCASSGDNWKQDAANATLIAAVPEMLELLQLIVSGADERAAAGHLISDENGALLAVARYIVAKATGEKQ